MWSTKNKERDECRAYYEAHKEDKWFRRRYYPSESEKRRGKRGRLVCEAELIKLGRIDIAGAIEKFKKESSTSLGRGILRCTLCEKKFNGERFLVKHFESRHADAMEKAKDDALFFNNYLADADRPCAVLKRGDKQPAAPSSKSPAPSQPPAPSSQSPAPSRGLVSYRDFNESTRVKSLLQPASVVVEPSLKHASQPQGVEVPPTSPQGRSPRAYHAQQWPPSMRGRAHQHPTMLSIRVPPPKLGAPHPVPSIVFPPSSMTVPPPQMKVPPPLMKVPPPPPMTVPPPMGRMPQVAPRGVFNAMPTRGGSFSRVGSGEGERQFDSARLYTIRVKGPFRRGGIAKPQGEHSRVNTTGGRGGGAPPRAGHHPKSRRFHDIDAPI